MPTSPQNATRWEAGIAIGTQQQAELATQISTIATLDADRAPVLSQTGEGPTWPGGRTNGFGRRHQHHQQRQRSPARLFHKPARRICQLLHADLPAEQTARTYPRHIVPDEIRAIVGAAAAVDKRTDANRSTATRKWRGPLPRKPISGPWPIYSAQTVPRLDSAMPAAIARVPMATVLRMPIRSASQPIGIPPTPLPIHTNALASASTDRSVCSAACISRIPTTASSGEPKDTRQDGQRQERRIPGATGLDTPGASSRFHRPYSSQGAWPVVRLKRAFACARGVV